MELKEILEEAKKAYLFGIDSDHVWNWGRHFITHAHDEATLRERSTTNLAIRQLAKIIDFKHITPDIKEAVTMYLKDHQKEDVSRYIRILEDKLDEAYREIRRLSKQ